MVGHVGLVERAPGRGDGRVHVGVGRVRCAGDDLLGGRINYRVTVGAVSQLTADEKSRLGYHSVSYHSVSYHSVSYHSGTGPSPIGK